MPADTTFALTLTTHPDHLAAAEVVACRYTFDGRWLEQTRDGEWRDTMPRPDDERENEIARLRVNLEEANRKVIDLSDDRNAFKADASEWKRQYEAAKGRIREMEQRLARAEAIENVAWEVVRWMNPETEAIRGLRDRLWHALGDSAPVEVPEHGSSSGPCPDCGSSRWMPDGDCPACVGRTGAGIVTVSDEFRKAADIEAETPIASSFAPVAVETEAEPADPRGWYIDVDNCRVVSPSGVVHQIGEKVETEAERELTRLREEVERLKGENKELRADVMGLQSRQIDAGQVAIGREWFDTFREAMEDVVSYWRGSHPDLNRRIRVLVKAWEAGGKVYVPLDERLASLRAQLAASQERESDAASDAKHLQAELAKWEAWSAETARRCEALIVACDKHLAYWSGFYRPDLVTLRQAVEDARRPATTEVRTASKPDPKDAPEGYLYCNACGHETARSDPAIQMIESENEVFPLCPECGEVAEFSAPYDADEGEAQP